MIAVGARVHLRACPHGQPGTVVRIEGSRAVVLWHDLDYLARHPLASLAEVSQPVVTPASPDRLTREAKHASTDCSTNTSGAKGQGFASPCDSDEREKA